MHIKRIAITAEAFPTTACYPFNLQLLQDTRQIDLDAPVTFFVGENGTGKSTLLEAIARNCGIQIWDGGERPRYQSNPYEKMLAAFLTVQWTNGRVPGSFFAAEIFRHFSQLVDEWAVDDPAVLDHFGSRSLMTQSHGQSHLAYFKSRYAIKGLYFLDEPENALSPSNQLALMRLLYRTARQGCAQFLIATHSPLLLSLPGATIFSFDSSPIRRLAYEDTEHYRVYRDFFKNPADYMPE